MKNFTAVSKSLAACHYTWKSRPPVPVHILVGMVLLFAGFQMNVVAQTSNENSNSGASSTTLEEIKVTARRREESLQDIPDSVSVLTARMIEDRGITRLDDIVDQTSNLFMINDQDPGTNVITIRGITTNRNQPGSVAFVIDGVTQPDTDGFTREYFDLERIEVLKGPQGALYGKNAIGGVINIVTKTPGNEYETSFKETMGNGGLNKLQGTTSGALVKDQLFYRLAVSYKDLDGYIDNATLDREIDFSENKDFRGRLIWQPNQNWSIDVRASYMNEDSGATWFSATDLIGLSNGGRVSEDILEPPDADFPGVHERTLRDFAVKMDYAADWGTITSLTAYNEIEKFFEGDLDNTPLPLIQPANQELDLNAWTQELRFTSPDDQRLRYIVGMFYQATERDFSQAIGGFDVGFFGFVPSLPIGVPSGMLAPFPPLGTNSDFEQWAGFGQLNYDITPKLELGVALRFDSETRIQFDLPTARRDKARFYSWQPKFTLSRDLDDNLMLYGMYSQGFKSGGFNPPPENFPSRAVNFDLVIDKEETEGFELGFKSIWWDERLRLNTAAFYTDYKGLQLFQFDPFAQQVTINLNAVTIYGFETELVISPAEGLRFDFSLGYTDTKIDDFNGTGLFDDNTTPNTPEYTLNLGLQYEHSLADNVTAQGRLEWKYVGDFFWQEDNVLFTEAYDFLDLHLSLQYRNWKLGLWGKNLTDERWAVGGFSRTFSPLILGTLGADNYTINQGRQVGVDIQIDF